MNEHGLPPDELASAFLDDMLAEADADAVRADPNLAARAEELRRTTEAVGAPADPPAGAADAAVAAALADYEARRVTRLDTAQQRRTRSFRLITAVAATVAVGFVVATAIGLFAERTQDDGDATAAPAAAPEPAPADMASAAAEPAAPPPAPAAEPPAAAVFAASPPATTLPSPDIAMSDGGEAAVAQPGAALEEAQAAADLARATVAGNEAAVAQAEAALADAQAEARSRRCAGRSRRRAGRCNRVHRTSRGCAAACARARSPHRPTTRWRTCRPWTTPATAWTTRTATWRLRRHLGGCPDRPVARILRRRDCRRHHRTANHRRRDTHPHRSHPRRANSGPRRHHLRGDRTGRPHRGNRRSAAGWLRRRGRRRHHRTANHRAGTPILIVRTPDGRTAALDATTCAEIAPEEPPDTSGDGTGDAAGPPVDSPPEHHLRPRATRPIPLTRSCWSARGSPPPRLPARGQAGTER